MKRILIQGRQGVGKTELAKHYAVEKQLPLYDEQNTLQLRLNRFESGVFVTQLPLSKALLNSFDLILTVEKPNTE